MKEIKKEQVADLFANVLGILTESQEEMTIAAAKVAGAREKGTSDKRYLSKMDSVADNLKEQLMEMTYELVHDKISMMFENIIPGYEENCEAVHELSDEFCDVMLDWYKRVLIKGNEIAVNTVLHPERAKADKKELHSIGLEFNSAIYNFILTVIAAIIKLAGGEENAELDSETKEVLDFVVEVCEDKVTDIGSQKTGKKKVNPTVRDPEEVKKIANETEKAIENMYMTEEEVKECREASLASGFGMHKRSFVEMSRYFNA